MSQSKVFSKSIQSGIAMKRKLKRETYNKYTDTVSPNYKLSTQKKESPLASGHAANNNVLSKYYGLHDNVMGSVINCGDLQPRILLNNLKLFQTSP